MGARVVDGIAGATNVEKGDPLIPGVHHRALSGLQLIGVRAFDIHRVGPGVDRRCLAPSGMADRQGRPLLTLNAKGYWVRAYGKQPAKLRKAA